jgi:hypothetical protein
MSKSNDLVMKLEDLKYQMIKDIDQIIEGNPKFIGKEASGSRSDAIKKLKPSKHKMAYRINNNYERRSYVR